MNCFKKLFIILNAGNVKMYNLKPTVIKINNYIVTIAGLLL